MRLGVAKLWQRPRWRKVIRWGGSIALAAGLGFFVYMKLVEGAWIRYNQWDHRVRGSLRVGVQAPDLELPMLDAGTVRLSELWRERPVFLVFGSCT